MNKLAKGSWMNRSIQEMTIREYFAAMALQGICASGPAAEWVNERLASESYGIADAMLAAGQENNAGCITAELEGLKTQIERYEEAICIAMGCVEYDDWPELQAAIERAREPGNAG